MSSTDGGSPYRRVYIDWTRGIAVLLMIWAHTTDAWTSSAAKKTAAFRDMTILGGFAAPLFLWLAGLAVVLAATRALLAEGARSGVVKAVCRRGLEIFILAFLFRAQAFVVSPGGHPVTLFRVDILNIMGPAVVIAGLIWGLNRTTGALVASYAIASATVAMLTPIVREASVVAGLPTWLQWYVRPAGEHTTFTAFPWAGFVFAGGACGALIATTRTATREARLQVALGAIGAVLIAGGLVAASRPSLYGTSSFWTSSPSWFAIRVGIMMLTLSLVFACACLADRVDVRLRWLERLGRSSLFVYWIHVELVYGYTSWPIHGRLPLGGTVLAWAAFGTLMYGAILIRDRAITSWRNRNFSVSSPVPARLGR